MFGFRSGRRAVEARPVPSDEDIVTAHAWGLTLAQWDRLDDGTRRYCRENVAQADNVDVMA